MLHHLCGFFVRRNKTDTLLIFVFLNQLFDIYMNYVNYSTITGASSRSDENRPNPVDGLIIIINNRLIGILKTLIAGMKSACVFHPIRAKSNYKKIEEEVEI